MVILVCHLKPSTFLLIFSTIAQKLGGGGGRGGVVLVPFSTIIDFVHSPSELLFSRLMVIKPSENFQVRLMKGLKMTVLDTSLSTTLLQGLYPAFLHPSTFTIPHLIQYVFKRPIPVMSQAYSRFPVWTLSTILSANSQKQAVPVQE